MRSIVPRILLWLFGTVVFALIGTLVTAHIAATRLAGNNDFMAATQKLQVEAACHILDHDGIPAVREYLERLDSLFRGKHYLVDSNNRDLTNGRDLADLARRAENRTWKRDVFGKSVVLQRTSTDSRYRLLIEISPPFSPWEILPYFVWVFVVILVIGYAIAIYIVRPLRSLQNVVKRFGEGEMDSRVGFHRRDEFGELGRAFDNMAERIEALVVAERRLLQDISHELRSPLTRLRFALDLARSTTEGDAAFLRVYKEVARLTELVDQLLQLTRAEGDASARNVHDISLPDLISESVDDFQLEAEARECILVKCLEPQIILPGDHELIRRAIDNVLGNAVRHAPPRSEIVIDLRMHDRNALVSIRDQGPGVPEEMLSEIFKPFRRVESDRNRDTGGLGLGLSIARRAVVLHRGTITAINANPGLEVKLVLPHAKTRSRRRAE
jgi:two-component system sensor histidine kinase CpxA